MAKKSTSEFKSPIFVRQRQGVYKRVRSPVFRLRSAGTASSKSNRHNHVVLLTSAFCDTAKGF